MCATLLSVGARRGAMMATLRCSEEGRQAAAGLIREICHGAYRASIQLAREKGPFPLFEARYLQAPFIRDLPADIRAGIATHGVRNSHLLAIAPTGTISLLAGNISSGIEPIYDHSFRRRILDSSGGYRELDLHDYACSVWRKRYSQRPLPSSFVRAADIEPADHLAM